MSESRSKSGHKQKSEENPIKPGDGTPYVFGGFWVLVFFGTLMVGGPWAGYHAVLLAGAALLMFLFPPAVSLPRVWWLLAAAFGLASMGSFLPAAWFTSPEWRGKLEALGLESGSHVVIQSRQAAETLFLFVVTLLTGLWLAGHRATAKQIRLWALMFTCGVAVYAVLSKIKYHGAPGEVFGFFPNRNHTATYLAAGSICGLGCVMQALRDRRFAIMGVSLVVTCICLWAVAGWSISRGGVLLVVVGSLIWVFVLGKSYLGKHGMRVLGLLALAAVGFFFIADSAVKQRIAQTMERAKVVSATTEESDIMDQKVSDETLTNLDFRVPTALDTFDLIRDFKWTGVGPGQFEYVFPQYRKLTAVLNNTETIHPESDWLWLAAETGIPATLALAALVAAAFSRALSSVLGGRDRALRGACLTAALLVPLHGLFDVPGHRIPLAWCSAFLFALALHIPNDKRFAGFQLRRWFFRTVAVVIMIFAAFLARAEWWGGPAPARAIVESALMKAKTLHAEDAVLQKEAAAAGVKYQPGPGEDRLDRVVEILQDARKTAPMDRQILRMLGTTALFFDDQAALADRSFALQRALDPTWVDAPMQQAQALIVIDPKRAEELWKEAIIRAGKLDLLQPDTRWSKKNTIAKIRRMTKNKPEYKDLLPTE